MKILLSIGKLHYAVTVLQHCCLISLQELRPGTKTKSYLQMAPSLMVAHQN